MRMNTHDRDRTFLNAPAHSLLALLVILIVALSCNMDLGELAERGDRPVSDDGASTGQPDTREAIPKTSAAEDRGNFVPRYSKIETARFQELDQMMRDEKVLEDMTAELNRHLSLPHDVGITFDDCGEPNAYYEPKKKLVTVCYEFMEFFFELFTEMGFSTDEANEKMVGATEFFFLHEIGHALIDVYKLPAVGREEDAVDQLSTIILVEDFVVGGEHSAESGVLVFRALAENEQSSPQRYANQHSLSSQRFYNIACWMYGKDPEEHAHLVSDGVLPESRAARCEEEYRRMASAWGQLVGPYRKR